MISSNFSEVAPAIEIHIPDDSAPETEQEAGEKALNQAAHEPQTDVVKEEIKEEEKEAPKTAEKISRAYQEKLHMARELRQQQQALKEAQLYRDEALAYRKLKESAKRDSLSAVRELGIDEVEFVNRWVQSDSNDKSEERRQPISDPRLDKVDVLEKELMELRQERQAQQRQGLEQSELNRIGSTMTELGDRAETLQALEELGINVRQQILDRALQECQAYGVEPSYADIIATIEKESEPAYNKLLERFSTSKKYSKFFSPSNSQPQLRSTIDKPKYIPTGGVIDRETRDLDDAESDSLMLKILKGEINP